jgi:hypothetical protein
MVNYGNGKIYRIVCNQTGLQYIGSTTIKLSARISQHKKLLKSNISGASKLVLENDDYNIILIEDYPCERKEQLLARERYHIENSHCVNKKIPLRTQKEWYMENKDRLIKNQIMWNNANREKCMEYQSRFRNKSKGIVVNLNGEEEEVEDAVKLVIEELYDGNILESAEDIYKYIEDKFNNQ